MTTETGPFNADLVAALERERLTGMPRWKVRRDTPEEIARRRAVAIAAEIDDLVTAYPNLRVIRRRSA